MARDRVHVTAVNGSVVITCLPGDARDLAAALGSLFVLEESTRPSWTDDVVALHRGAAMAEQQAGNTVPPVMVPVARPPFLQLVAGGDPA